MNNKILVLYLHPEAFDIEYDEGFSEKEIREICTQSERIVFKNECYIFRFKYQKNDFVFVLTKENDPDIYDEDGVPWPELKEILGKYIQGKYDVLIAIGHKDHIKDLKLEFESENGSELNDYGGFKSKGLFYSEIKDLIKKFGEEDSDSCQTIIDKFVGKKLSDVEFKRITTIDVDTQETKNNGTQKSINKKIETSEIIESRELDDILKELKDCRYELTIMMTPAKRYYIKPLNSETCFLLVRQKEKKENTEDLKKVLNTFKGERVYMAIHGISGDIDFDAIKLFVNKLPCIKLYYCNYSRSGYPHIKIPYKNIIKGIEVEENYDKLKKAIKQSYLADQKVEAINIITSLFYPLTIDLRGLAEVPDEMKIEYFNDMLISIKNRYEDHLTYFRQKLVNLRYFVIGTIEESTIDSLCPNVEIFKDFNLKSLLADNINKQKAEELSGLMNEDSPIISFMKLLDEALEKIKKEERIEIIRKVINYFKEIYWEVSGRKINNYHDWFILVVNTLIDIKKEYIDDKH